MQAIENEQQYDWALKRVEQLWPEVAEDTPADNPMRIELELLGNMVADYEEKYHDIGEPTLIDTIKLRMFEKGLTQVALSKLLGVSPSRISDYLSGKSEPTMRVARKISKELDIDPAIVLGV